VVGIYNSGYGSADIKAALRKFGAAGQGLWVSHEMLDRHRRYIEEVTMDVALDQDPEGHFALQNVLHACGVVEDAPPAGPVAFRIFCPANVRRSADLPGPSEGNAVPAPCLRHGGTIFAAPSMRVMTAREYNPALWR
jgi:LacI family transcriptional regulator